MSNPFMYQVIEKNNLEDLVSEIQTWVGHGWTPQGGVSMQNWEYQGGYTGAPKVTNFSYAQAMVLYLENVDPKELEALKNLGEENA